MLIMLSSAIGSVEIFRKPLNCELEDMDSLTIIQQL